MKIAPPEKPACLAAGLRIIFLVIMVLLLLPTLSPEQFAWPSGGGPPSLPGASKVRSGVSAPSGLRTGELSREDAGRRLDGPPDSGIYRNVTVPPATLGRLSCRCPLPTASAFSLQSNLRKYLELWPTPGTATTAAWREYVPEDGEEWD